MNKKGFFALESWLMFLTSMIGCNEMDNYSVSPNHLLSFSTDTVSFDTVFTTIGSTTSYFMIYNKNDEALKIDKILLSSGGRSGFRINVDGRKGDSFGDVPIWKKDSLYVAVEVTVDPNNADNPFVIYDSVVFITNGMTQSVLLEAYGQNARIQRGGVMFRSDTTLDAVRPYLVYDSIIISEGVTVEIEKGTSFYMHKNARWIINGTVKANGTQEEPVVFRGDRLSDFSTTISYDNISAQWNGLFFGASSFDNYLNYAMIRNGISGLTFAESTPDRKKITIVNSQIMNMDGDVLSAVNCHIEASNTEFGNASRYLVMLCGGKYQFTHCTMVNYMPSSLMSNRSSRFMECLTMADNIIYINENGEDTERFFPLQQAYFDNCIIDGSMSVNNTGKYGGEIFFSTGNEYLDGDDSRFNYRFNHCLVKTQTVTNERFREVLFEESPTYIKSKGTNAEDKLDFVYDFRLADESAGIGKADRAVSEKYPVDRLGTFRLTSETGPSIGAYEYVPQNTDEQDEK
ncbi:MAG: hypothetical protein LBT42_02380 [Tannerella sp.]|jgi:hypothetical protein|nr:hypothetical protein [Tannerella sp.]